MQGDLDLPPIIIRISRARSFLMLLMSVALTLTLLWAWRGHQAGLALWLVAPGLALFALGVPLFAWEIIRPEQLILSPSGLEWRSLRKTLNYGWDQLSDFTVITISGSKLIGFSVTDTPPKLLGSVSAALTGASGALPGLWEIEPEALAEMLNSARSKWSLVRT